MAERNIKPPKGAVKKSMRVGRGDSAGKGSTCGRGHKGQKSRSGGGVRPGFEGGQMPLYRRVARRGFSNYPFKKTYVAVNIGELEKKYSDGETVNLETLKAKNIVKNNDILVKILGTGELTKKLSLEGLKVSASAKELIEKAGGTVELPAGDENAPEEKAAPKKEKAKKKTETKDVKKKPQKEETTKKEGQE